MTFHEPEGPPEEIRKLHRLIISLREQVEYLETDLCTEVDARLAAEQEDDERDHTLRAAVNEIRRDLAELTQAVAMISRRSVHQRAWDLSSIPGGTLDRS